MIGVIEFQKVFRSNNGEKLITDYVLKPEMITEKKIRESLFTCVTKLRNIFFWKGEENLRKKEYKRSKEIKGKTMYRISGTRDYLSSEKPFIPVEPYEDHK